MKKIDKKEVVMIFIFIINIVFITIPYTYKNMKLKENIDIINNTHPVEKLKSNPIENYEKFNKVLAKNKVKVLSKTANITDATLVVDLKFEANVFEACLLTYDLKKEIDSVSVRYSDINQNKNTTISYILR